MDASPASSELRDFVAFRVDDISTQSSVAMRILIVDNDDRSTAQLKRQIQANRPDADDDIKYARHGLDVLVVAEEFQPKLVIIQLGLPRRSGACTAKLLRSRPWAAQVVIVSHSNSECPDSDLPNNFDFHFYGAVDIPLLLQMYRNLSIRRTRIDRAFAAGHPMRRKIAGQKNKNEKPLSI